jgi:hypothetical protein
VCLAGRFTMAAKPPLLPLWQQRGSAGRTQPCLPLHTSSTSCSGFLLLSTVSTCLSESKRGSEKQGSTLASVSSNASQSTLLPAA